MVHEMTGCQCGQCQRYRAFRAHVDPLFDAEIEKRVRHRINQPTAIVAAHELSEAVKVAHWFRGIVQALRRIVISSNN